MLEGHDRTAWAVAGPRVADRVGILEGLAKVALPAVRGQVVGPQSHRCGTSDTRTDVLYRQIHPHWVLERARFSIPIGIPFKHLFWVSLESLLYGASLLHRLPSLNKQGPLQPDHTRAEEGVYPGYDLESNP